MLGTCALRCASALVDAGLHSDVVVAINPYEKLEVDSDAAMKQYANWRNLTPNSPPPPHPYRVAGAHTPAMYSSL